MAKDKKSFLLYCDFIDTFEDLTDEEAGRLIKLVFRYVNDKNPETEDKLIKLAFNPIKQALKRDLIKYEQIKTRNRKNAQKRWMPKDATASDRIPDCTKNADSDSVSDNGSVIDINNILSEHEIEKTIQFASITLRREYTSARVAELWDAFLINGQKSFYESKAKRISHFRNWLKTQPHDTHKQPSAVQSNGKLGTSAARIEALKNW